MLPPTPTQLNLVWIGSRRKMPLLPMSFTISKWLKRYYFRTCQCVVGQNSIHPLRKMDIGKHFVRLFID